MKLIDAVICWTPRTANVAVLQMPVGTTMKERGLHKDTGATWSVWKTMSDQDRIVHLLATFIGMTVRDKLPIDATHAALLEIDEYRMVIPIGVEGADPSRRPMFG